MRGSKPVKSSLGPRRWLHFVAATATAVVVAATAKVLLLLQQTFVAVWRGRCVLASEISVPWMEKRRPQLE